MIVAECIATLVNDIMLWSVQPMPEWIAAGKGARLMMPVHHDDAAQEWVYVAKSKIGTFIIKFGAGKAQRHHAS